MPDINKNIEELIELSEEALKVADNRDLASDIDEIEKLAETLTEIIEITEAIQNEAEDSEISSKKNVLLYCKTILRTTEALLEIYNDESPGALGALVSSRADYNLQQINDLAKVIDKGYQKDLSTNKSTDKTIINRRIKHKIKKLVHSKLEKTYHAQKASEVPDFSQELKNFDEELSKHSEQSRKLASLVASIVRSIKSRVDDETWRNYLDIVDRIIEARKHENYFGCATLFLQLIEGITRNNDWIAEKSIRSTVKADDPKQLLQDIIEMDRKVQEIYKEYIRSNPRLMERTGGLDDWWFSNLENMVTEFDSFVAALSGTAHAAREDVGRYE